MANKHTLAELLWNARTEDDIKLLIDLTFKAYGKVELYPVGERPNNSGVIELSSDPTLASVERITNAMDAVLEYHAFGAESLPSNPREAASKWLKIPAKGIKEMSDSDRRKIAENVVVMLEDSGTNKRPTLIIQDKGLGIESNDFIKTILSLNAENKVNKKYTMGTFGQGGSSTFVFSKATIIISRKQEKYRKSTEDTIAWTLVQKHFDPSMKTANYSYLSPRKSDEVFTLMAGEIPEMTYGTRVVHIAYDLHGISTVYTLGGYQFYNSAVFDPLFPFLLGGSGMYRAKSDQTGTRVILGNRTRLNSTEKAQGDLDLVHSDEHEIDLGSNIGFVTARYWVVAYAEDSDKKDPASSYVSKQSAVSVTLFGQRQDQEDRSWIKEVTGLSFIHKNIIVQIEADSLTQFAKSEFFSSTRERARKTEVRKRIYDELAERLRDDQELKRLNNIEKEKILKRSTGVASEKLKKRLNDFIQQRKSSSFPLKDGGVGSEESKGLAEKDIPKKYPAGVIDKPRKTDDKDLPFIPTYIRFQKKQIAIQKGKQTPVWVEIDAKNGFIQDNPEAIKITWPASTKGKIRVKSKSKLIGGHSQWYLYAEPDSETLETNLTVSIETPTGEISGVLIVQITDPKVTEKQKTPTGGTEANIDARWVFKENWEVHEFGPKSVGKVVADLDGTIIFVNRHFYLLERAMSGSNLTEEQINVRSERYLFPIACALWLQENDINQIPLEVRPSEEFLSRHNEYTAEAVLAAMNADIDLAAFIES